MKILHTSDWHLGRSLYGRKRYEEFSAFLDWLSKTIENEKIDILLVAGDVFDSNTPSNRAQELYYRFLCRIATSNCRHVVVIAGNHDSPSFLNAPKELLRALNIHVVGSITDNPADEVLVLYDNKIPKVIVCAIPYLRDRDIRIVDTGESIDDKNIKLVEGVKNHYSDVCEIAERKQAELKSAGYNIPIVAMGHLFTLGGKSVGGDGVRNLYVGSLAHIDETAFPSSIDYLALGHLHVPQIVGKSEHIRYCGSPIPMGYGEATQEKKVVIIESKSDLLNIEELTVPRFQELARIVGSIDDIQTKIIELKNKESCAWLEIEYTGNEIINNLCELVNELITNSKMEVRRIKNRRIIDAVINANHDDESLQDIDANDVFVRCLDAHKVQEEQRGALIEAYNEIIKDLMENDHNAE